MLPMEANSGRFEKTTPKRIRVMLADDNPLTRHMLSALLDSHPGIEIIGEASDGEKAIHLAWELKPDIILMYVDLPKMNGVAASRIILSEFPEIRIIGYTVFNTANQTDGILVVGQRSIQSKVTVQTPSWPQFWDGRNG